MSKTKVVVTGMGAITSVGTYPGAMWTNLLQGQSGIRRVDEPWVADYPTQIMGLVPDFEPTDYMAAKKAGRMARFSQFAVAASKLALENAGLCLNPKEPREDVGVCLGNAAGGIDVVEDTVRKIIAGERLSPFAVVMFPNNLAAFHVAHTYGAIGYCNTVATACAAGTQAIGEAMMAIRSGKANVVIAGGAEGGLTELALALFCANKAYSRRNDEPERASRPFDAKRDGFVGGEGAGILILESEAHALARDAHIYAEVLGYGSSNDAFHLIAPHPDGYRSALAMSTALKDAGIEPDAVDYINAHGTGTPQGDATETKAIKLALGRHAYEVAISSTKSMIGHLWGAAGAVEAIATVLTIDTDKIHPTINLETPDPACDLDYVPRVARQASVDVALKNSSGLGGNNAAVVFGRYQKG